MPKLDSIHDAVKSALIKDGWIITDDPYKIQYKEVRLYADLAAERPFAAERAGRKIVVEVKSFAGPSLIHELEVALGQYHLYQSFLGVTAPDRKLYLAISHRVFEGFFSQQAVQFIMEGHQLSMLIVNINDEEIVKWIN